MKLWHSQPTEIRSQSVQPCKRMSASFIRKMAQEDSKRLNTARFKCPVCNAFFAMTYGVFVIDTRVFLSPEFFVCRDDYAKGRGPYQKVG